MKIAILDDYVVYLQESNFVIRTRTRFHFHKPLEVMILLNGLMP
jgi:hypothetical protein